MYKQKHAVRRSIDFYAKKCNYIDRSDLRFDDVQVIQKGQTLLMNRGVFHSVTKKHMSFHRKADIVYQFRVIFWDFSRNLLIFSMSPIKYSFES